MTKLEGQVTWVIPRLPVRQIGQVLAIGSFDLSHFCTGFDPIFYLHHCQIDRLLSIWSAANPNVWVTESHQGGGTATIPDGAVINRDTGEYMAC